MTVILGDPISDMLTRIRNAINVRKNEISLPHSNIKEQVALLMKRQRLVDNVSVHEDKLKHKTLTIVIHAEDEAPRITEIVRLSKPGRRQYSSADKIPVIKNGRGLVLISTSQGLMTGQEAKRQKIGGELICRIY
jgi:small subunit ribosomal protein S8